MISYFKSCFFKKNNQCESLYDKLTLMKYMVQNLKYEDRFKCLEINNHYISHSCFNLKKKLSFDSFKKN